MKNHNQINGKRAATGIACSFFAGAILGISAGDLGVWSMLGIAISVASFKLFRGYSKDYITG